MSSNCSTMFPLAARPGACPELDEGEVKRSHQLREEAYSLTPLP